MHARKALRLPLAVALTALVAAPGIPAQDNRESNNRERDNRARDDTARGNAARSQERTASLDAGVVAASEAAIEAVMKKEGIPGLTVAVGRGGRVVWTRGFGFSDVENHVKAEARTSYRLASISKPVTAVAAMQLAAQGKLELDAPVQKYVPAFPQKRWTLTPRHLLSHLGGVRHYRGSEIYSTRHYPTVRSGVKIFAADPLLHEPGTKFRYSTYGYNLLGAAVSRAAGARFARVLRKNIFEPAGMTRTRVDSIREIIPNRAQGYTRDLFGKLHNANIVDTSNKIPGGGLCGTATDLVNFAHALIAGKLLKKEIVDEMWRPAKTKAGKSVGYGLGFRVIKATKPRIVGHSGGQPRVSTMLLIRPDERVVVAVMCNLQGAEMRRLARRLGDRVCGGRSSGR